MLRKTFATLFSLVVIVAVLLVNVVVAQEFVTEGLIGFWTLDEDTINGKTAHDVWGDNHGEIIDHSGTAKGKINEALELDGVDDCVQLPDLGTEVAVTVEVWVNLQGGFQGNAGLVSTFGAELWKSGTIHFRINEAGPGVSMDKNDGGVIPPPGPIEQNQWYHCAYTCDTSKNEMTLYVDGEPLATTTSGGVPNNLTCLRIGASYNGRYFPGILDEVRIYNRALSDDEIEQNYNVKSNSSAVKPSGKLASRWGEIKL